MEPANKKAKLDSRFRSPQKRETMQEICKGFVPANTKKATGWAIGVFNSWRAERNQRSEEKCPAQLLEKPTVKELNYCLSRFVVEVRRGDQQPYPPTSISNILSSLYRYSREHDPECPNFLNRRNVAFKELNVAIYVHYRELHQAGVGAIVRHAPVVEDYEGEMLWEKNILGDHSPLALQRAVFFYVGKVFCLRGGEEQRGLKTSQLVRSYNPDCYTYVENGSKNRSGANLRVTNKVVPVYALPKDRPRCLVYLLDTYLNKLPAGGADLEAFYLQPLKTTPKNANEPWY